MSYWVQIEFAASGVNTGAMQIDLEKVERVHIKRENKKIAGLVIKYKDEPGFSVDAIVAAQFLDYWDEYLTANGGLQKISPEAEPGIIEIASKSDITIKKV